MKYLVSILVACSLLVSWKDNRAGVKELPEWWSNDVFSVSGNLYPIQQLFESSNFVSGNLFEYEIILTRETNVKGTILINQILNPTRIGNKEYGAITTLKDGYIKIEKNNEVLWLNSQEFNGKYYVGSVKLLTIDLNKSQIMFLKADEPIPLKTSNKRINKRKTITIQLGDKSYSIWSNGPDEVILDNLPSSIRLKKLRKSQTIDNDEKDLTKFDELLTQAKERIESEEYAESIKLLNQAIAYNKSNTQAWGLRALAYQNSERFSQAIENYLFYYQYSKNKEFPLINLAQCYYLLEEYDLAKDYIKRYQKLNPQNAKGNFLHGHIIRARDKYDPKQCTYFKKASSVDSLNYQNTFNSFCSFEKLKLEKAVVTYLDGNIKDKSVLIQTALKYAEFHSHLSKSNDSGFDFDINRLKLIVATDYLKSKNESKKSIPIYKSLLKTIKVDSIKSNMYYDLAIAYRKSEQWFKSLDNFKIFMSRTKERKGFQHLYRMALFHVSEILTDKQDKHEEAIPYLNELIELKIGFNSYIDWVKYEFGIGAFNHYLQDLGNNLTVRFDHSQLVYTSDTTNKQRASLWPLKQRARSNFNLKRYESSVADWEYVNKLEELDGNGYPNYMLGLAHYFNEDYRKSIENLEKCLSQNYEVKEAGFIEYSIGSAYFKLGEKDKACSNFRVSGSKGYDASSMIERTCFNTNRWEELKLNGRVGKLRITNADIERGDLISIKASGTVRLGFMAGSAGPDGLTNGGFKSYNRVRGANHGALLARIGGSGDWWIIGKDGEFTAENSGVLELLINDSDPGNNAGQFVINVVIKKK